MSQHPTLLCLCGKCFAEGPDGEEATLGPPCGLLGHESIPCERCEAPVTRDNYHWVRKRRFRFEKLLLPRVRAAYPVFVEVRKEKP